jgi:acyl carrier protein
LLRVDIVGIDDNFFDLGGHSLLLVQLQSRLAALFQKELPLVEIFRYPSIRLLARYFTEEAEDDLPIFSQIENRMRDHKESLAKFKQAATLRKGSV